MRHRAPPAWILALLLATTPASAQVQFTDVAGARGFGPYSGLRMGSGAAAADYDDDGDVDLFLPDPGGTHQLLRNDGTGHFTDLAGPANLTSPGGHHVALWVDVDGDQDLDLLLAGGTAGDPIVLTLFRQDTPTAFTDITTSSGLPTGFQDHFFQHAAGLAAGDVDRDGLLDIYFAIWNGFPRLFHNQGGTFTEIGVAAGVTPAQTLQPWQPLFHDFDRDGWQDLYVAVDFGPNQLWINQGDATFLDEAPAAGAANWMNDMGIAPGDYDDDGDLDLYITNIYKYHDDTERNVLLRNDSTGGSLAFVDVAPDLGVENSAWGWGTTFLDADNDGRLDLAATNGFDAPFYETDVTRYFHRTGGGFTEMAAAAGLADVDWGSSLIAFDADRDGDLDLVQTCVEGGPVRLLDNGGGPASHHWLVVQPRMSGSNHRAIGAVVRVVAGGVSRMRLITAGTSFLGQEPAEAFFGLGSTGVVDQVVVEWPDGSTTVRTSVGVDQVVEIQAGATSAAGPAASLRLLGVAPNPANPAVTVRFRTGRMGATAVHLYDAAGRRARSLDLGVRGPGDHAVVWDGHDDRGRPVASGSYLVRVVTAEGAVTGRVVLVR